MCNGVQSGHKVKTGVNPERRGAKVKSQTICINSVRNRTAIGEKTKKTKLNTDSHEARRNKDSEFTT